MDFFRRHRNLLVLALVLFVQVLGLAFQVRRSTENGPVRLVHLWGIGLITPGERVVEHGREWVRHSWKNYFYLLDVRRESEELRRENLHLRLEQVRLTQDASQAQRLQALLQFKEQFISETVAAQVIGSSGSGLKDLRRVIRAPIPFGAKILCPLTLIRSIRLLSRPVRTFPNP